MCQKERDVLREVREIEERDMEKFGTLDGAIEKTIDILRDRW